MQRFTGVAVGRSGTVMLLLLLMRMMPTDALSLGQCDRPLGMESGDISDSQISASSAHNDNSVGPHSGRIRTEHRGGAWCPLSVITADVHEFLQIDLGRPTVVTAAETQGRFGNGRGREWAERYSLQYWRPGRDGDTGWRTYRNASGHTLLDGNVNSYLAHKMPLNPPLIATKVRLVPRSEHPRTVCLRAELYGCLYTDGIQSYSMDKPDPSRPDLTYDGTASAEVMADGLGQLTDGQLAEDDVTKPEWVGWRRRPGELVTITFVFDAVRELESASFHVSNRFTSGVRMFSRASLYFSVDGAEYTSSPLSLEPAADRIFENSRQLEVRLYRQVGQYVRVQLMAADQWLLLSEVTFVSEPSSHNVTGIVTSLADDTGEPGPLSVGSESELESDSESESESESESAVSLAALLAALGLVLLLLSALVGYVVRAGRRRRVAGGPGPGTLQLPLARNMKQLSRSMQLTPRHGYCRPPDQLCGPFSGDEDKVDLADDRCHVVRLNSEYNTLTRRQQAGLTDTSYEYAVPVDAGRPSCAESTPAVLGTPPRSWDNPNYRRSPHSTTQSSSQPSVCSISELLPAPPPIPPPPPQPTGASCGRRRRLLAAGVQGVVGTCIWTDRGAGQADNGAGVTEISGELIKLRDRIGQGRYGEIRVCEVHSRSSPASPYQAPSRLATARTLRPAAPAEAAACLRLEAGPLCRVTDRHVTRLLGLCTLDQSPGLLVEHMENGDLNEFLRRAPHDPARPHGALDVDSLVYVSEQIAAGMEHLESLGIVHGDLAARNCLVGHHLKVKVGDLGPSRSQYAGDYITLADGRVIPLRWRAPEAVFTEEMDSCSDVWSFSVTLWEVLTWCRLQPLAHLSDAAVTDRLSRCGELPLEPYLQQPNACPPALYQLMTHCWRLQPQSRPSFKEIRDTLRRRNAHFEPLVDDP